MKYALNDTAQQFIYACRRTAARLQVTEQEIRSYMTSDNRINSIDIAGSEMNVVSITDHTTFLKQDAESQSA